VPTWTKLSRLRPLSISVVLRQHDIRRQGIVGVVAVLGQNGSGQNGTDKMVWTKWYGQNGMDKMVRTKW